MRPHSTAVIHIRSSAMVLRMRRVQKKSSPVLRPESLTIQQPKTRIERKVAANRAASNSAYKTESCRRVNLKIYWRGVNIRGALFQKKNAILRFDRCNRVLFTKILAFFLLTALPATGVLDFPLWIIFAHCHSSLALHLRIRRKAENNRI